MVGCTLILPTTKEHTVTERKRILREMYCVAEFFFVSLGFLEVLGYLSIGPF